VGSVAAVLSAAAGLILVASLLDLPGAATTD